jgi:hypothetical protein
MFYVLRLDIAYILQWIHTYFSSVLDVCYKCLSGCFKSRSSVTYVAIGPTYRRACPWEAEGWNMARRRAQEVEGDGGRGIGGPCLCVQ